MTSAPTARAPVTWVLTEGAAGMINQCLALTDALDVDPVIKRAKPATPWALLPPWLALPSLARLAAGSDRLDPPYPDLLIACGRKSIGLALALRRESRGRTFVVYVQDPRLNPARFDLVVAPRHDRVRGPNVVLTRGAPTRITRARLDAARLRFAPLFHGRARPMIAVLLGGKTRHHPFKPAEAEALGRQLASLANAVHGSLAITPSRRTPEESLAAFRVGLGGVSAYVYEGGGENPYLGMLAHADAIVVTADSVNMVSDACSTGCPVFVASLEGRPSARFTRFLDGLREEGRIRPFEGRLEAFSYAPLDDAAEAAGELKRRLAVRSPH